MDQEPIPSTLVPPARKFSPILILAAVILLVVVGVVGIFLGKSLNNSQKSTQPTVAPLPTQIPIPTPDENTNWKTYRNEKYGLEFRYPSLWNLITNDFGKILAIRSDNGILEISVDVLPSGLDNFEKYKKYIEQIKEVAAGDILYSTSGFADFEPEEVNKKESDLENKRSVEYEFKFNKPAGLTYNGLYWSYVSYGNRLAMIYFKYRDSNDKEIFNQILSTFKFLD